MIARVLCDEFGSGSLIVTMLIAILPVLIPEVREWAIMWRENKLEDRLAEVEQSAADNAAVIAKILKRRDKKK